MLLGHCTEDGIDVRGIAIALFHLLLPAFHDLENWKALVCRLCWQFEAFAINSISMRLLQVQRGGL
jgi:hypothetical protein